MTTYRHFDKVTDLDHAAKRDPIPAASSSGPVFVCIECGERVVPQPERRTR